MKRRKASYGAKLSNGRTTPSLAGDRTLGARRDDRSSVFLRHIVHLSRDHRPASVDERWAMAHRKKPDVGGHVQANMLGMFKIVTNFASGRRFYPWPFRNSDGSVMYRLRRAAFTCATTRSACSSGARKFPSARTMRPSK